VSHCNATIKILLEEFPKLKTAKKEINTKLEANEARREGEQVSRCKHVDPEKFQEGGWVRDNSWLDAMESSLIMGNISNFKVLGKQLFSICFPPASCFM
jgi:hypothetical protein